MRRRPKPVQDDGPPFPATFVVEDWLPQVADDVEPYMRPTMAKMLYLRARRARYGGSVLQQLRTEVRERRRAHADLGGPTDSPRMGPPSTTTTGAGSHEDQR